MDTVSREKVLFDWERTNKSFMNFQENGPSPVDRSPTSSSFFSSLPIAIVTNFEIPATPQKESNEWDAVQGLVSPMWPSGASKTQNDSRVILFWLDSVV